MIVIDVGCARYGGDFSIERLIEEFHPRVLYGFDPAWDPSMLVGDELETRVEVSRAAAWVRDGFINFAGSGLGGHVTEDPITAAVTECIDLAKFIKDLPDEEEIVLKIDAEGAEYELLDHLIANGVDERLSFAWIEWHKFGVEDPNKRRKGIEKGLRCPIDEWRW